MIATTMPARIDDVRLSTDVRTSLVARASDYFPAVCGCLLLTSGIVALFTIVTDLITIFDGPPRSTHVIEIRWIWLVGWATVLVGMASLLLMFGLWTSRVTHGESRIPIYLMIGILAVCDVAGTACFLVMTPTTIGSMLPSALGLSAGVSSILYCLIGLLLQAKTKSLSAWQSVIGYSTWLSGLSVAICTLMESTAMIFASGLFWVLMPTWCFVLNSVFRQQRSSVSHMWRSGPNRSVWQSGEFDATQTQRRLVSPGKPTI